MSLVEELVSIVATFKLEVFIECAPNLYNSEHYSIYQEYNVKNVIFPILSFCEQTRSEFNLPVISKNFFNCFFSKIGDTLSYTAILIFNDNSKEEIQLVDSLKYLLAENKFQLTVLPLSYFDKILPNVNHKKINNKQSIEDLENLKRVISFFKLKEKSIYDFSDPSTEYFDHIKYKLTQDFYATNEGRNRGLTKQINYFIQKSFYSGSLDFLDFSHCFNIEFDELLPGLTKKLKKRGLITVNSSGLQLTELGKITVHNFMPAILATDRDSELIG